MGKSKLKKIIILAVTALILLVVIMITRMASEQNGTQSNMKSGKIVSYVMESLIQNDFPVNRNDVFWKMTANALLRKAAHFTEYMLIGIFLTVLLNLITKKMWISIPAASIICFALAYLDEYRQQFVVGRGSTWFDVRIDTYGSLTGIAIATVFFLIFNKFLRLKDKLRDLEEQLAANH